MSTAASSQKGSSIGCLVQEAMGSGCNPVQEVDGVLATVSSQNRMGAATASFESV